METNDHLKFILKLLGCKNYRSRLAASAFKCFKNRNKICQDLGKHKLVDYTREVGLVKILPPGQALLKLDSDKLPLTDNEFKVLKKINQASGEIVPAQIKILSLRAHRRDLILKHLSERGLIEVETKVKRQRAEVWLTERGLEHLRDDYSPPQGSNPVISLDLLNNYLQFLRNTLPDKSQQEHNTSVPANKKFKIRKAAGIRDEEILQIIQELDRELGTQNYLPIFHLRENLQPPFSRDELDKVLYRLQENDQIEFSTLQEAHAYTPEQINTGIPQNIGGPLFFISLN